MKNFVQPGDTITVTAPAAVSSGDGVLVGSIFGVAHGDAAINAEVELKTSGVFDLPKTTGVGEALAAGALAYWDDTAKKVSYDSGAGKLIGVAVIAAGDNVTPVRVRLNGAFVG